MTDEPAPPPAEWVPHSYEGLRIAMAAFLHRVRGDERHSAMLVAEAGHRGLAYDVFDSALWLLEQVGHFEGDEKKQAKLEHDIVRLAGWETEEEGDEE
ncbi:hypothetical protein [Mycolicibacterium psychrotolerans]|uniref:Uncharacterized protein n=1 Tax=Mycolicibacterium psychrotolerans TaxID=216929 RepID=A0A7I7MD53_9MYCO|nr:hypothetical protein [Mycolicibacterium psychrotolerans]BBX70095.1 hypothetical protein MPSYJ_35560 [Mycolicibacterium psychrotolerans]